MEKIICGGFELGEGLQMDGNVLNVTSSGGGLPPVTGSGKALVSVNGEWVEQDGYGYTDADATVHKIDSKYLPEVGGSMVIEGDAEATDASTITVSNLTKTFAEVKGAVKSGKSVNLKVDLETAAGESLYLLPAVAYVLQTATEKEAVQFVINTPNAMLSATYSSDSNSITVRIDAI